MVPVETEMLLISTLADLVRNPNVFTPTEPAPTRDERLPPTLPPPTVEPVCKVITGDE